MGRHTQLTMRNYGKSNQQTQEYRCKNNQFYPVTIIKNENKIQILPNQIMWHKLAVGWALVNVIGGQAMVEAYVKYHPSFT